MRDLLDLGRRLDHAQRPDDAGGVDRLRSGKEVEQAPVIRERHAQMGFGSLGHADPGPGPDDLVQRLGEHRHALVGGPWRGPGAHVVEPRRSHGVRPDRRHHGDRFAGRGDHHEPGPGRALPELGQEAREIADLRLGGEQQGVETRRGHQGLRPGRSRLELGDRESARRTVAVPGHQCRPGPAAPAGTWPPAPGGPAWRARLTACGSWPGIRPGIGALIVRWPACRAEPKYRDLRRCVHVSIRFDPVFSASSFAVV